MENLIENFEMSIAYIGLLTAYFAIINYYFVIIEGNIATTKTIYKITGRYLGV